jgi:hypothetical protein
MVLFFYCYTIITKAPYNHMFESVSDGIVTDDIAVSRSNYRHSKFALKKEFIWDSALGPVVAEESITVAVLESKTFKTTELTTGRNLLDTARNATRNIKKLISLLLPKLDHGKPKLSGQTMEQVLEEVREEMWTLLKGKVYVDSTAGATVGNNNLSGSDDDDEAAAEQSSLLSNWTPIGWMAFLAFGPTSESGADLPVFTLGDPKVSGPTGNKADFGRKAHRKKEAKQKEQERQNAPNGSRGLSFDQKLGLATLSLKQKQLKQEKRQERNMAGAMELNLLKGKIDRALRVAELTKKEEDIETYRALEREETVKREAVFAKAVLPSPDSGELLGPASLDLVGCSTNLF